MSNRIWDVVAITAGVVKEAQRLAWDRMYRRYLGPDDVPASMDELTPAWLERVLRKHGTGARVSKLTRLSSDAGTTERAHLRVDYEGSEPAGLPTRLFVKISPASSRTHLFVNLFQLGPTEVRFYQEVAAAIPVPKPRVYHAAISSGSERFVLVQEDLGGRVELRDATQAADLEESRRVVQALARVHAVFWESPRLRADLGWLKSHENNPVRSLERSIWTVALKPGVDKFRELVPGPLYRETRRLSSACDEIRAACATGPRTLLHGDPHIGNLFFRDAEVGLFDWQCVQHGQGMHDLSYFLCTSIPIRLRRSHERELIELYRETLGAEGVRSVPSLEQLWTQYRWHSLHTWGAIAITAAAVTLQAAPIVRAALERSAAAALDLDALELI